MYITGNFVEEYEPTIDERYRPSKIIDDETAIIEIIDLMGYEDDTQQLIKSMIHCDGFMLCFALNQRQTFLELNEWLERIKTAKGPESTPCICLVGNKCDLESDREVNRIEEEEWAKQHGLPVIECSAKTDVNVAEAFAVLIRLIREKRNPKVVDSHRKTKPCVLQ